MSPKGHFCTLSLLKRNKAASWDEPKKKKISPSFTHTHTHAHLLTDMLFAIRDVCIWKLNLEQEEFFLDHFPTSSRGAFVMIWGCSHFFVCLGFCVFCKPYTYFFSANPGDLSQQSEDWSESCWGLPKYHLAAGDGDRENGHLCYWALLLMLQIISQSTSTKTLSSLCRLKRG